MRVYEFPGFPNPARVRLAAAECELSDQIEYVTVDVPAGEHRQPEFLAKNPLGAVPVLELDDGTTISECTAITEYLDQQAGERRLTGNTAAERAHIHMMQRRVEAGVLEAFATYFHHATPGLGEALETYQNAEWGEHQKARAQSSLQYLDEVLASNDYVAGAKFSIADITLIAALGFADFLGLGPDPSLKHLHAWRERVNERPAMRAAA